MASNPAGTQPIGSRPAVDAPFLAALAVLVVVALALRIAASQGALWLDEAWSALFAREARTPAGVFFAVNHDNNHFLNTLWLQAVGWGAPPLLSRALSIASGTAAVAVGAWIALRRGRATALATALLLALSPILVIYGAEARGYAPMLLALLVVIAIADHWLFVRPFATAPFLIGIAAAVGLVAHLTMLFGIVAVGGWVAATLASRMAPLKALEEALQLMRWAVAATLVLAAVMTVVAVGASGYRLGSVLPFSLSALGAGLGEMLGYSFGLTSVPALLLIGGAAAVTMAALWRMPVLRDRAALYVLAILLLPASVALLRLGNSGFPRYFLVTGLVALLFAGDLLGIVWQRRGAVRVLVVAALALFCVASLTTDIRLIRDRRGDPGLAITAMRSRAPQGASVAVDNPRSSAVLASAGASAGYPMTLVERPCPPKPFLFVDEDGWAPFPERVSRCGVSYDRVVTRSFSGLSGLTWALYSRDPGVRANRGMERP